MKKYLLTVFVVIVALIALKCVADAQEAPKCDPMNQVFSRMARSPFFSVPREVKGPGVAIAVRVYNQSLPESNITSDVVFAVDVSDAVGGGGVLFYGHGTEFCYYLRIDAAHWNDAKRTIEGFKA